MQEQIVGCWTSRRHVEAKVPTWYYKKPFSMMILWKKRWMMFTEMRYMNKNEGVGTNY